MQHLQRHHYWVCEMLLERELLATRGFEFVRRRGWLDIFDSFPEWAL